MGQSHLWGSHVFGSVTSLVTTGGHWGWGQWQLSSTWAGVSHSGHRTDSPGAGGALASMPWEVTNDSQMIQVPPALQKPGWAQGDATVLPPCPLPCHLWGTLGPQAKYPSCLPSHNLLKRFPSFSREKKNQLTRHHWDAATGSATLHVASVIPEGQDGGSNTPRHCWL